MRESRKLRKGVLKAFFSLQSITQWPLRTSLEKQLDPRGPIAYQGVSVPAFLTKPMATCGFQGGGGGGGSRPCVPSLDPPMVHVIIIIILLTHLIKIYYIRSEILQGSYRQVCVKVKELSRTSK